MAHEGIYKVGVLGATGVVGQKAILLIQYSKLFKVNALGASEKSAGKKYSELVRTTWKHGVTLPEEVGEYIVRECVPDLFGDCDIIFSCLDASVAYDIENNFKDFGFPVFTNSSAHRMNPSVPLCVPTANPDHIKLVEHSHSFRGGGYIVANSNCSTTGIVTTLKALMVKFGHISDVIVTTMQAISGAGYPGVPSMDILSNVIPHIAGEEQKIETESLKILSPYVYEDNKFLSCDMNISASCNRVPVHCGHTICVSVKFKSNSSVEPESVIKAFEEYDPLSKYNCISTKCPAIIVHKDPYRPQPVLDCCVNSGYTVVVGGVRKCNCFDIKYTVLLNNIVIGASGSSLLNAEIAHDMGLLKSRSSE